MVSRSVIIGIGILIVVILGFMFLSNITGNVITGSVVVGEKIENEYLLIDSTDKERGDDLNDAQNSGG